MQKLLNIISFLSFYIIITPIALFCRLIGKDILDKKISKNTMTYWNYREKGDFDKDSYNHQY